MKTITERDGKNVNMQVVGDLHQYPDGSVHTAKNGKDVWEEGSGSSGGSGGGGIEVIEATLSNSTDGSPILTVPLSIDTLFTKLKNGAFIHASFEEVSDPYFLDYFIFPSMAARLLGSSGVINGVLLFSFIEDGVKAFSISDTTDDSVTFTIVNG